MSTKTITLSEDAYESLKALKGEKDSFSDIVRKLTAKRSLTELATLFTPEEGERIKKSFEEGRALSRARATRQLQ